MSNAVVVFSFPEPTNQMDWAIVIDRAKKAFEGVDVIKVTAAKNEIAECIIAFMEQAEKGEA